MGDAIIDPAGDWDPTTAQAYIDSQIESEAATRLAQDTYLQNQLNTIKKNKIYLTGTTLSQSQINQTDTIYVVKDDLTLAEDITVPANCVLEFEGGSISNENNQNYKFTLDCTPLYPMPFKLDLYFNNVEIKGVYKDVSVPGKPGTREDKFAKGQFLLEKTDNNDQWMTEVKQFDGYQLVGAPLLPKSNISQSGRINTIKICNNWINYKINHPSYSLTQGNNTCFLPNFDDSKQMNINCSTFAMCTVFGITFENSRYFLGSGANNIMDEKYYPNKELLDWMMSNNYNSSRDVAYHLYKQGFCFKPADDLSNLDTGDLLFYDLDSSNDREGVDFLGIDHTSVFGFRNEGTNFFTVYEAGSYAGPVRIKLSTNISDQNYRAKPVLCARLPKKIYNVDYKNILYNCTENLVVSNVTQITTVKLWSNIIFSKDHVYTAVIKLNSISNNAVFDVRGSGVETEQLVKINNYRSSDGYYYLTFVPTRYDNTNFSLVLNGTGTFSIDVAEIYLLEGIVKDTTNINIDPNIITTIEGINGATVQPSMKETIITTGRHIITKISGTMTGVALNDAFTSYIKINNLPYNIQGFIYGNATVGYETNSSIVHCQARYGTYQGNNSNLIRFAGNSVTTDTIYFSIIL